MRLPDYITIYVGSRKYRGGQECPDHLVPPGLIEQEEKRALALGAKIKHPGIVEKMTKLEGLRALLHRGRIEAGNLFDGETGGPVTEAESD